MRKESSPHSQVSPGSQNRVSTEMPMPTQGWKQLVAGWPWFHGAGRFPIDAYSEFMPPPRLGPKPYSGEDTTFVFSDDDPWGWHVSEYEEAFELQSGLERI